MTEEDREDSAMTREQIDALIAWGDREHDLTAEGFEFPDFQGALRWQADRIAALEARETWRPIETAPKDGSAVLGYGIHTGSPPDAQRGVRAGDVWWSIMLWDIWRPSADGGEQWVFAKDGRPLWADPTHWMPLPPAPDAAP